MQIVFLPVATAAERNNQKETSPFCVYHPVNPAIIPRFRLATGGISTDADTLSIQLKMFSVFVYPSRSMAGKPFPI